MAAPSPPRDEVRDEIVRALGGLRPRFRRLAEQNATIDPGSRVEDFSDEELEQFINAWEAMFLEALEGRGRATRDLVFDTALEPVMQKGQTALDMVRSNVVSAVTTTHRLLEDVSPELREEGLLWLAAFFSDYTHELAERALAVEGGRR